MSKKTAGYLKQVDEYCQQAKEELKRGNLREAGEKYWTATTYVLKAYCQLKGWQHDDCNLLFKNVREISSAFKDKTLIEGFGLISMLYLNFYESWLNKKGLKYWRNILWDFSV